MVHQPGKNVNEKPITGPRPYIEAGRAFSPAKAYHTREARTDREVAQAIIGQFPDTDLDTLEAVTARHRQIGVWNTPLTMEQASLERLETVMTQAGELTKAQWVDFNELVDNHWAEAAR